MAQKIIMPKLGLTMTKGQLVKWLKEVGDPVKEGEPLFELMTDKITYEVEAPASGILLKKVVQPGEEVAVETTVGYLGEEGEEIVVDEKEGTAVNGIQNKTDINKSATISAQPAGGQHNKKVRISPRARRLAEKEGINIELLQGSGPGGRIIEKDVKKFIADYKQTGIESRMTPAAEKIARETGADPGQLQQRARIRRSEVTEISRIQSVPAIKTKDIRPFAGIRKIIGERLSASKLTAPHIYLTIEVDVSDLSTLRDKINQERMDLAGEGKISFNVFVIKAVAMALKDFPQVNSSLLEDKIYIWDQVNIGFAVALDDGLVVPVIRDADQKGIGQLAEESRVLINKAHDGLLNPEDIQGGTFTISNLGGFGIDEFAAVINPPESAILAVGAIKEKCIPINREVNIRKVMKVTLSADHRLIDGAVAAAFLNRLKTYLEHPTQIFL